MQGIFSKDKLVFDPSTPLAQNDNIGAFVRAGNDGKQISWTQVAFSAASLILQDLTFTANCIDYSSGNDITVAYTAGGTAGSEVVTVIGTAISVQIDTGVSTATQVKAAIDAFPAAAALVDVAISGTAGNAQVTVAATNLAGGVDKQALDVHPMGSPANGQFHEDCVHTSGDKGQFILAVRNDANTSMVNADGDYAPLQVGADGRLKVDANVSVASDFVYAEDSIHADADLGAYILAVRADTRPANANTSTNGDYASFFLDNKGALWTAPVGTVADDVADTENPVKVGSRSAWGALAAVSTTNDRADLVSDKYRRIYTNTSANIGMENTTQNVDNTGAFQIAATPLEGRRLIMIQNLSNQEVYVGKDSAVSSTNGLVLAARGTISLEIGQDVAIWIRGSMGSAQNLRILQVA